jgi:hypothetical protein
MPTDYEVVRAMHTYGGHFTRILAELCDRADPVNLAKIKATWPEYWQEYAEMSDLVKAQRQSEDLDAKYASLSDEDADSLTRRDPDDPHTFALDHKGRP